MPNQRRTIPTRVTVATLTLLAIASFAVAPPTATACAPSRPENDGSPVQIPTSIERGPEDPCNPR